MKINIYLEYVLQDWQEVERNRDTNMYINIYNTY